jgi:hypothetical protein
MNIEIRDFYPIEVDSAGYLSGTVRVSLVSFDILGVFVARNRDKWFCQLPGQRAKHHESGKIIRFPFLVLHPEGAQDALMAAIREKTPPFIEKWLADRPGFTKTPPLKQKQQLQAKAAPRSANAIKSKQTAIKAMAGEWRDPPKRASTFIRGAKKT